ncbi:MAG TPA: hypothetical protein VKP08_20900, partial [Anaerolineales bacterium]|nr:hypothetical protein [Anaerolineales bacterium]
GLPVILSGHNNYYLWGPDHCTGEIMIILGGDLADLQEAFRDARQAGQTHCEYCMPFENNLPIYVAHGLKTPLEQAWPGVKSIQ